MKNNTGDIQNSLPVLFLKTLMSKMGGNNKAAYSEREFNLFLVMAASGDKKSYEFVSGNLRGMTFRHVRRVIASRRSNPFINTKKDEIIDKLRQRFQRIRGQLKNTGMRIAFTVGIDATIVVPAYQHLVEVDAIVGGAHRNHVIDVSDKSTDDVKALVKDCLDKKHGDKAAEVKIVVLCFQRTPPGMCPYLCVQGRPQTVNDTSDYGSSITAACKEAAQRDGNTVVLNTSTDGVYCETVANKSINIEFLEGKRDDVALVDTNHNGKNKRYQLFGGSSPESIGRYVFDSYLLVLAKVEQELVRVKDYASDALILRLASSRTVSKLHELNSDDIGNASVTAVSHMLMRCRLYAVNSRNTSWWVRASLSYMSLLWFTSFHNYRAVGSYAITMLPNKRNMWLETIAVLFLTARDDVSKTRGLTSECNEHFFGMIRTIMNVSMSCS